MNINKLLITAIFFISIWQRPPLVENIHYANAVDFKMQLVKNSSFTDPNGIIDKRASIFQNWWSGVHDSLAREAIFVTFNRAFQSKSGKENTIWILRISTLKKNSIYHGLW
jgi:hypothetical protein